MLPSTLSIDPTLPPGASIEDQVLLQAARACILPSGDGMPQAPPLRVNWAELGKVAVRNKMAVLLLRGSGRGADRMPQDFRMALEEQQNAAVLLNTRNLMALRLLVSTLQAHAVESVVLKGPCAQKLVYGDFFVKPSSDVDVLVARRDFERVGCIIADCGFVVAEACRSTWWKVFLGEQHFLSTNRAMTTVDLHHRLQQPGCPAPRRAEAFLSRPTTVLVGNRKVPTLSRTNATLLSCMSLVKALIHREPAGGHVCDIAAGIVGHSPEEMAQLAEDAGRQGLRNTLGLGLRSAALLLGVSARVGGGGRTVLADIPDADLLGMILRPWSNDILWHRRSRTLWDLCDSGPAYLKELSWKIAGELCFMLYRRQQRSRTPA